MAINFPDSPLVNDTFVVGTNRYEWDGSAWRLVAKNIRVTTDTTAPATPLDGQLWFDTNDGTLSVYYNDGTSSQWVTASGPPSISIATGGGGDQVFWENENTVTTDYTITDGRNAMSAGPVTIANGVTVTIGSGETWRIV